MSAFQYYGLSGLFSNQNYAAVWLGHIFPISVVLIFKKKNHINAFNKYLEVVIQSGGLPSLIPKPYNEYQCVNVNTIHSVKGAEFPIVFLPFHRSASFPLNFRSEKLISKPPPEWLPYGNLTTNQKGQHIQEERRLFYVAVTRAQDQLYLLAPKKATSPFIKELPEELMNDTFTKDFSNEPIPNHSQLRVKYEQQLQKALSREDYKQVKKICGILLETRNFGTTPILVIGIGVNLLSSPNLDQIKNSTIKPGSILDETGVKLDPIDFSESIAHYYALRENQLRTVGFPKIRETWMDRAAKLGKKITARTPNFEYHGIFDSVDENGQLVIISNGEKKKIAAAEIFF